MESPDHITLYPDGLLSKFGFEDGDVMFYFMSDRGLDLEALDHHDLLIAVVERLLIPRLDQTVETYVIEATLHNPIRAGTVDEEEASIHCIITPDSVDIPVEAILEVYESLLEPKGRDWSRV